MHLFLLSLHSLIRWILCLLLWYSSWLSYVGWKKNRCFSKKHALTVVFLRNTAIAQLIIAALVYFQSPIQDAFWSGLPETIHNRQLRFFAIEHSLAMVIALGTIIVGTVFIQNQSTDLQRFKVMGVYCTISLLIIIVATPWEFSQFVSRPLLRLP